MGRKIFVSTVQPSKYDGRLDFDSLSFEREVAFDGRLFLGNLFLHWFYFNRFGIKTDEFTLQLASFLVLDFHILADVFVQLTVLLSRSLLL